MNYTLLFICLGLNILLLIVFKLFPKYGVENIKGIVVNYFICLLTGTVVYQAFPFDATVIDKPWFYHALFLGFCFISIFNVVALTLQKVGATVGTIFQRMSLLFPILVAFLFFNEQIPSIRALGILLAILCIVLINMPSKGNNESFTLFKKYWYLPLLTLFGNGLIESTLFYLDETQRVVNGDISFVSFLFFSAGIWGTLFLLLTKNFTFKPVDMVGGIVLGVPNFFTIYLLLRLLSSGLDASIVFPFLNVGVILCGSLIGIFFFKEKLNYFNMLGVLFAIIAILMIVN